MLNRNLDFSLMKFHKNLRNIGDPSSFPRNDIEMSTVIEIYTDRCKTANKISFIIIGSEFGSNA